MTEPAPETADPAGTAGAERFIPIRKREIVEALAGDPSLGERESRGLRELARRLSLIFHVEYFAHREALKDLYVRFNPDQPGAGPIAGRAQERRRLLEELESVLTAANFERLSATELAEAETTPGRVRARISIPAALYEDTRFYGRGRRVRPITVRRWFGLKRETLEVPVYDHIVLVAAMAEEFPKRARRRSRLRPGAVYLKLFRNIARADLETLYPEAKAVMRVRDIALLVVPAIAGGVPIMLNLLPAVTVLLVVVGAYLGVAGTVEGDALKQALAALSGLGALGGFIARQWIKYERQALKYAVQVANNAYFNNLSNNAGFFDQLVGASEESEVKEALLAYAFLREAGAPLTRAELDARIEAWLADRFGERVDFEIDDALGKLERLRLVYEDASGLRAVPLDMALARCEETWASLPPASAA